MKLSIITVNLNDATGLKATIESVKQQTFTDFEFLIIDGGSTDGSLEIIKQYEGIITYWISEPDKGIYNAMNKGISRAKGEYCYFLNSGDSFYSDTVLEKIFENDPHEPFICGSFYYEENGVLSLQDEYKNRDWTFSLYEIYSSHLCHQAFFIHRHNFEKYGLYEEQYRIMSDWKLFLEAIGLHREPVRYVEVDVVIYNLGGLSYTVGGKVIYEEKKQIAKEMFSPYLANKLDKLYQLEINSFWVDFIKSRAWIYFLMKCFYKTCAALKLTKT